MHIKNIILILVITFFPHHLFSSLLLSDTKGRSIELSPQLQLHISKKVSPGEVLTISDLDTATVEKFLHYSNVYMTLTKKPFYPPDVVDELAKINASANTTELLQLFELAHMFDMTPVAYAFSLNYLKTNMGNKNKDALLSPVSKLSESAQKTMRKHYFLLSGDASAMHYTRPNGEPVTLTFTLQEISHIKRLEIENTKFNLSGLFLSSIDGLQVPRNSVDTLDLSNNLLTELPQNFGTESTLKKLNLANNKLRNLPDSLSKLTQLEVLDVTNNQLTQFPESINKLTNLWRLDADSNNITEFQESLCKCTQLRWINFNNNKLSRLPENFICLSNIDKLYLQGNDFSTIPQQVYLLPNLRILSIKNGTLTQVPTEGKLALKSVKLDINQ